MIAFSTCNKPFKPFGYLSGQVRSREVLQKIYLQNPMKYFWVFQKHSICIRQRWKICAQLDWLYHSKNLTTKLYISKTCSQETLRLQMHLDSCLSPHISQWCNMCTLVLSAKCIDSQCYAKIRPKVISIWLKDFLLLNFMLILFFSRFSPCVSSSGLVVLGLLGLELSEK